MEGGNQIETTSFLPVEDLDTRTKYEQNEQLF